MLYTKIEPQSFLSTGGRRFFKCFLPYMGMTTILFNDAEPFEQSVNIPWTESGETGQVVLGKASFKYFKVLYLYIAQG